MQGLFFYSLFVILFVSEPAAKTLTALLSLNLSDFENNLLAVIEYVYVKVRWNNGHKSTFLEHIKLLLSVGKVTTKLKQDVFCEVMERTALIG